MFGNQLFTDILLFLVGFALLTGGAEFLIRGASRLAARFNVSPIVIGLTIVAFGTSLPELLVSVVANLSDGGSTIAIGNIVGSNNANMGLILGIAGMLTAIHVERHLMRSEFPLMLVVSVVFAGMGWNGTIDRLEGGILMVGLVAFMIYTYTATRTNPLISREMQEAVEVAEVFDEGIAQPSVHPLVDIGFIALGLSSLVFGAEWLVESATSIARTIGVSELVIGLTLVAVGTSLPELATTVVAIRRREGDLAIGNVVGSNLFNILFIGGIASVIRPLEVPLTMHRIDFPVMIGLSVLVYLLVLPGQHQLVRWKGAVILGVFLVYSISVFVVNGATP